MMRHFMRKTPKNVDEYIAGAPKEVQDILREFRIIIRSVVPKAEERISYGIPHYEYNGRLAYFAAFKKHTSLFVPPPTIAEHAKELENYKTTKSSVHFPIGKPLPATLIKKLIKGRMKKNETKK
jgi:uncharacterized protein YdhG (YjbR/CyaY superfamily)